MLDYLEPQLKERLAEVMTSESFTGVVQQKLYQAIPLPLKISQRH